MIPGKKYGLVHLKQEKKNENAQKLKDAVLNKFQPQHNIFEDDSGSENDEKTKPEPGPVKGALRVDLNTKIKKKTLLDIEKALKDDPSVYQYDEIYDNMQKEKELDYEKKKIDKDRKPKYIAGLLRTAEYRKHEDERRTERTVQKELEKEGDEFKDKEQFVTEAYKKKMIELKLEEEKLKRQDVIDERNDVMKKNDLSGFYRKLLDDTTRKPKLITKESENSSEIKVENSDNNANLSPESSEKISENKVCNNHREKCKSATRSPTQNNSKKRRHRKSSSSPENNSVSIKKYEKPLSREDEYIAAAKRREAEREKKIEEKRQLIAENFQRKTTSESISDAKMRYLIRKQEKNKPIIEKTE